MARRSLILHPTSTAQWQSLLLEAQQSSSIYLNEELESYLVFLLMRFTEDPSIATSILGLEFLQGYQQLEHSQSHQRLKEVGDKCLLFSGLFPGRALKKRVKLSYFVKLGQTAYSTLSSYLTVEENLFVRLCDEFPKMMDVLQAMRENPTPLDLLQSIELWHETGSPLAWRRLLDATQAIPVVITQKKSVH